MKETGARRRPQDKIAEREPFIDSHAEETVSHMRRVARQR